MIPFHKAELIVTAGVALGVTNKSAAFIWQCKKKKKKCRFHTLPESSLCHSAESFMPKQKSERFSPYDECCAKKKKISGRSIHARPLLHESFKHFLGGNKETYRNSICLTNRSSPAEDLRNFIHIPKRSFQESYISLKTRVT
jgi:hypothetical protein